MNQEMLIVNPILENNDISQPHISIVIPVYNEAGNLVELYTELNLHLQQLHQPYEIIFIDDGSTDLSRQIMEEITSQDPKVIAVFFRRNYGQTAAMSAGFKLARGEIIITLDSDLQNDPADIAHLLAKMNEGYDLVSGWRKNRQDTLLTRKIPSYCANKLINWLISGTQVQLNDYGCTLKAYKREIVKNIHIYGEMHRFIPAFAAWLGVKIAEIPVNHRPRVAGATKYDLTRTSRVLFDLIVVRFFADFMTRPMQFFGRVAKIILQTGISILIILSLTTWFGWINLRLDTFLILSSVLVLACLQILIMGLTGELLIRNYFETLKKDHYVVEKIINY